MMRLGKYTRGHIDMVIHEARKLLLHLLTKQQEGLEIDQELIDKTRAYLEYIYKFEPEGEAEKQGVRV